MGPKPNQMLWNPWIDIFGLLSEYTDDIAYQTLFVIVPFCDFVLFVVKLM